MSLSGGDKVGGQVHIGSRCRSARCGAHEGAAGRFWVTALADSRAKTFDTDVVVHAAERAPDLAGLDSPAGGVEFDSRGVTVDEHLQSVSNPAVYAAGDAANRGELPETRRPSTRAAWWRGTFWTKTSTEWTLAPWGASCTPSAPFVYSTQASSMQWML